MIFRDIISSEKMFLGIVFGERRWAAFSMEKHNVLI